MNMRRRMLNWRRVASLAAAVILVAIVLTPTLRSPPPANAQLAQAVETMRGGSAASRGQAAAILAALVAAAPQTGGTETRAGGANFQAFDIYLDSPEALDGVLLDISIPGETGVVVGLEAGDAPFADAPTYDAARLASGQLRIASVASASFKGRVRIATISINSADAVDELQATPVDGVAVGPDGARRINATFTCVPRSSP